MYRQATRTAPIVLPLINPSSCTFRYVYAVFSTMEGVRLSLSFNLPSNTKAVVKLREELSRYMVRESHMRNLFILACMPESINCPAESLFVLPIIVDKFMSCTASENGIPILLLSVSLSLGLIHSLPISSMPSITTVPQLLHTISPDTTSVTSLSSFILQVEHVITFDII